MRLAMFAVILLAASCAARAPNTPEPDMDLAAARFALDTGDASIEGSGCLRQRGGDVVSCAGSPVWLIPDTPFFQWASDQSRIALGRALSRPEVTEYVREATCDVDGRFTFDDVPAGAYLAGTVVTWEVPGGPPLYISSTQGGPVFTSVDVETASAQTIAITR